MKTSINDVTAYELGDRYAVVSRKTRNCVAYCKTASTATATAKKFNGVVLPITGRKSRHINIIERNGIKSNISRVKMNSTVHRNPFHDTVDLNENNDYKFPRTTMERVKETYAPGIRSLPGYRESEIKYGTEWPIPTVKYPAPMWNGKQLKYLPHQIAGISAMIRMKNVLLADEQGLGKTCLLYTSDAADE